MRGTEGFKSDVKPNAHFTMNVDDFTKATENHMSSCQYEDLVNRMDKASTSDCVANMSGIASLDSQTGQVCEWIIDSRATHHITPNEELLIASRRIQDTNTDGVQVPTGNRCNIRNIGITKVLEGHELKNVLHVPNFKFSLLSV